MNIASNNPRSSVRVRKPLRLRESGKGLGKKGRFYNHMTLVGRGDQKRQGKFTGSVMAFFSGTHLAQARHSGC